VTPPLVPPEEEPQVPLLYDVSYFGNENTAGETPLDEKKYEYNKDTVTVLGRGNLYRVGYRFTGWNTRADGTGDKYLEGDQFVIGNGPMPIYAQWEEVFPRISAGENFSTLVTREGVLYAAGRNTSGRLGDGTYNDRHSFTPVQTTNIAGPVAMVSSGTDHSFAVLQNGSIVGWGQGDYGKLAIDQDNTVNSNIPRIPFFSGSLGNAVLGDVQYVCAGRYQTAVLTKNGEYWAAGTKTSGALGNGDITGAIRWEKVLKFVSGDVISVATGLNNILLIKKDGSLWIAGDGGNGKLGTANTANVTKLRKNTAIDQNNAMVFAGKNNHTMILKKDGRILSAGQNTYGQLGNGTTANQNYYAEVLTGENAEMNDVAFASLGDGHSMILKKDGTLWAVGRNSDYQLGISPNSSQYKAIKVLDRVAHVAAGYNHSLAVKEDGTLWAAGSNNYGQFGRGDPLGDAGIWTMIDISQIVSPEKDTPAN
jgi:alpha-tubulin suppressor-like RCC1 family protein